MRDTFVRRRGWLEDADFLDILGVSSLIPGPTSSELAMHIGHRRAGWPGLFVAGLAFLLPAVVLVGVLAWLYVEQGSRPEVGIVLATVAPVVVAVIAHAGLALARTAIGTIRTAILAVLAVAAVVLGAPEIVVLLGIGVVGLGGRLVDDARSSVAAAVPWLVGGGWAAHPLGGALLAAGASGAGPLVIAVELARIGAVLFGSGYVLVSILRAELVQRLGWISETQLLDAIAVGQATPGPLFSTATFVGYLVDGPAGAVAATIGIFAPAFLAVALSIPLLERLRWSDRARAFLDGVNAATVGLLAAVAVQLGGAAIVDPLSAVVGLAALGLLLRGVPSGPLLAGAVVVGVARLAASG